MAANVCPCGSGREFSDCCEPYLAGKAEPPTAEALMRARYSSYATGRIDFIEKTHAPESRSDFDRKASEKWSKQSTWGGLKILATKGGAATDSQGIISFVASFKAGGQNYEHREIATFRKEGTTWFFVDGKAPKPDTYKKSGPEIGRNELCHCGSGKKFKKCHGRQ